MAEFDYLFEQMSNISKASAYDILVPEIAKLKQQNANLLEACKMALEIRRVTHHGDDILLNKLDAAIKANT